MAQDNKATEKKADQRKPGSKKAAIPYLTKQVLKAASATGFTEAAKKTMEVMGYNLIVRNGWLVKLYSNGTVEKIKQIDKDNSSFLALD